VLGAVREILSGYARGTRHGIGLDDDGLLMAGESGVQLTWMDAKVRDHVITPRWGKPVEVQALWLNCLWRASNLWPQWERIGERGAASFRERFWNEQTGYLHDVVDCRGVRGAIDRSFRPNQIFAVGGLPLMLLEQSQARRLVDAVQAKLLTPLGLRSLAPDENGYCPRYSGGPAQRDGAYHQGTIWPWLIGPFVEAWVRVRGTSNATIAEARLRFLDPLLKHLGEAGLGHISEIADAEAPHMPRGCPFQAWSIAELLRLDQIVLAERKPKPIESPRHQRIVIR
jgi:glycogen debranching enzyme